jgi:DNA-binding MarR family transcriptional regulator
VPTAKRQPSDLEAHLGYWLRLVSNNVSGSFGRRVQAEGVSVAEWVALRLVYGRDDVTSMRLADSMGMTRGAISKIVARLERKRLLARTPSREDGRSQDLRLTAAGARLVPVLAGLADRNDEEFFAPLDRRDKALLGALLRKLVETHDWKNVPID